MMKKSLFGALALCGAISGALGADSNLNNSNLNLQTPVLRLFELSVAPEAQSELVAVGRENMTRSVADENATLSMYLARPKEEGSKRLVLELYADPEGAAAHEKGAGFALYREFAARAVSEARAFELAPKFAYESEDLGARLSPQNAIVYRQIELKRDDFAWFARELEGQIMRAKDDKTTLAVYAFTPLKEPLKWKIFWIYADEAGAAAHEESAEFAKFIQKCEQSAEKSTRDELTIETASAKGGASYDIFR